MIKTFKNWLSQFNPKNTGWHTLANKRRKGKSRFRIYLIALFLLLVVLMRIVIWIIAKIGKSDLVLSAISLHTQRQMIDLSQGIMIFSLGMIIAITINLWLFSRFSPIFMYRLRYILRECTETLNKFKGQRFDHSEEYEGVTWVYQKIADRAIIKLYRSGFLTMNQDEETLSRIQGFIASISLGIGKQKWVLLSSDSYPDYLKIQFGNPLERQTVDLYHLDDETPKDNQTLLRLGDVSLDKSHTLIVGPSGTRKTSLLMLLICLIMKEQAKFEQKAHNSLFIVDPKAASLYSLHYSIRNPYYATTPKEALELLRMFYQEIETRGKLLDAPDLPLDSDYKSLDLPPVWFILDEAVDLFETAKLEDKKLYAELNSLLVRCITKGRQLGCFVIETMMRADTTYISGLVRSTMQKIYLADLGKEPDSDGARMVFESSDLPIPPAGTRFYGYVKGDSGKPKLFLTPTYTANVKEFLYPLDIIITFGKD